VAHIKDDKHECKEGKQHTTEIWILLFAANMIENLLKGAPENPLPRAFTYASYKIKHTNDTCKAKLLLQLVSL